MTLLDGCSEGCGVAAAILAALSWGTFGVPIKAAAAANSTTNTSTSTRSDSTPPPAIEVNFFVMQSYKTIVCFVTSWPLVILLGEPIRWTPWGIVSGLFWVPGAACGIYGIRNAGVAVAVGTWSSIMVISSFIFGIVIFQERVKDTKQTIVAFLILMIGLIGMSRYSDSQYQQQQQSILSTTAAATTALGGGGDDHHHQAFASSESFDESVVEENEPLLQSLIDAPITPSSKNKKTKATKLKRHISSSNSHSTSHPNISIIPLEIETPSTPEPSSKSTSLLLQQQQQQQQLDNNDKDHRTGKDRIVLLNGRLVLTRRELGILGAVVNGAWGGLNLIPLHYAQRDYGMGGASYLISYASGSMIVCLAIWAVLFIYHYVQRDYSISAAIDQLPPWHIQELGLPGALAGLFYSIGNFCSILAVAYLGQGVGFSFCQGQLLVSGLWGVFYFQEISGKETIIKWFASAVVTIVGIVSLSYQHQGGGSGGSEEVVVGLHR